MSRNSSSWKLDLELSSLNHTKLVVYTPSSVSQALEVTIGVLSEYIGNRNRREIQMFGNYLMQLTLSQALSSLYHFRNKKKAGKPFANTKKLRIADLAGKP